MYKQSNNLIFTAIVVAMSLFVRVTHAKPIPFDTSSANYVKVTNYSDSPIAVTLVVTQNNHEDTVYSDRPKISIVYPGQTKTLQNYKLGATEKLKYDRDVWALKLDPNTPDTTILKEAVFQKQSRGELKDLIVSKNVKGSIKKLFWGSFREKPGKLYTSESDAQKESKNYTLEAAADQYQRSKKRKNQ